MWNWKFEVSDEGCASEENIWETWSNVTNWPEWDADLEWSKLEGPFKQGASGTLKPKNWKALPFTLSEVFPGKSFKTLTKMPLGTVCEFDHVVEKLSADRIRITHTAMVRGALAPIFRFTLKRSLRTGLRVCWKSQGRKEYEF